jgi:hypothetical protein
MDRGFVDRILELLAENGWSESFRVEEIPPHEGASKLVRVRLSDSHPVGPGDIVNDYIENVHSLEQVQYECLRAVRTGRPGI